MVINGRGTFSPNFDLRPGVDPQAVSEWRAETAQDLEGARARLEAALREVSGEPSEAQILSIWKAYVRIEKSIAFIRLDFEEENPGRFISLRRYAVPDERQALRFALRSLTKGSESFALGDFALSLKDLREARNYLRALLREKRLRRVRKGKLS